MTEKNNIAAYRNELTTVSRLFYSNGSDKNEKKVNTHRKFLGGLLKRIEKEPDTIKHTHKYLELYDIVNKAHKLLKVNKTSFLQRAALGLYARIKA